MDTQLTQINDWFSTKLKLQEPEHIKYMRDYLKTLDRHRKDIRFSGDYVFRYYEYDINNIYNIRNESIFKSNWRHIVKRLNYYFPNIKISILFEVPTKIQKEIIKKAYFRHDIYIKIKNRQTRAKYDCVLEYFEKNSHNELTDYDKKYITQQLVDFYAVYNERNNNLYEFMEYGIHNLLMLICTASDDHFILSKINFFKNYKDDLRLLRKYTDNYNHIIDYKKNSEFDMREFIKFINPVNPATGKRFNIDDFINYIEEKYNLIINLNSDYMCSNENFDLLILYLDDSICGNNLTVIKKIYQKAISILFQSQRDIIEYIKNNNKKKKNIKLFLEQILKFHIRHINKDTLLQVVFSLKNIFIENEKELFFS